jgi:hypothetical protein
LVMPFSRRTISIESGAIITPALARGTAASHAMRVLGIPSPDTREG